jgi:hypothetical protein
VGHHRPDYLVTHSRNGVLQSVEFLSNDRIVKRELYRSGLLAGAEYDDDGDGKFERHAEFDAKAERGL